MLDVFGIADPCICAKCADKVTEQELLPCLCTGGLRQRGSKRKLPLLDWSASNCGGSEFGKFSDSAVKLRKPNNLKVYLKMTGGSLRELPTHDVLSWPIFGFRLKL
jgi:hypothetical protein